MDFRWKAWIPGDFPKLLGLDPAGSALYVTDGWGVAFPAIRLRRLDLHSGALLAEARLGNAARCTAVAHDELLFAATDTRLFALDPATLQVINRWDRQVPRYTDAMVCLDRMVLMRNAHRSSVAVFDLDAGLVGRRRVGTGSWLFARPAVGDVVICCGDEGTVWSFQPADGALTRLARTPAFQGAALDPAAGRLWLSLGSDTVTASERVDRGDPTMLLAYCDLQDPGWREQYQLDFLFRDIKLNHTATELWAVGVEPTRAGTRLVYTSMEGRPAYVAILSLPELQRRDLIPVEAGHRVSAIFPEAQVAIAERPSGHETTELACLATGPAPPR